MWLYLSNNHRKRVQCLVCSHPILSKGNYLNVIDRLMPQILTPPCGSGAQTVCWRRRWCQSPPWRSTDALRRHWPEAWGEAQSKTKSDLTVHSCSGLWFQKHKNCLLNIIPESGCEVGGVHILPPQTGFSTNHKLLLFISSCLKMKYLMRKGSRSYFQGV